MTSPTCIVNSKKSGIYNYCWSSLIKKNNITIDKDNRINTYMEEIYQHSVPGRENWSPSNWWRIMYINYCWQSSQGSWTNEEMKTSRATWPLCRILEIAEWKWLSKIFNHINNTVDIPQDHIYPYTQKRRL